MQVSTGDAWANGNGREGIQTFEANIVQQECVARNNTFFNYIETGGEQISSPYELKLENAGRCCNACHNTTACNAWHYCSLESGCAADKLLDDDITVYPYQGCQLLRLPPFSPSLTDPSLFRTVDEEITFIAGAAFSTALPRIDSYDVLIGADLNGEYGLECPELNEHNLCLYSGSVESVANACDLNPDCLAFSYYSFGLPNITTSQIGLLKGGDNLDALPISEIAQPNPFSAVYVKSTALARSSTSDSNEAVLIGAIVGSVVGVTLLILIVVGYVYSRNYVKLLRSFPQQQKDERSSDEEAGVIDVEAAGHSNESLPREGTTQQHAIPFGTAASKKLHPKLSFLGEMDGIGAANSNSPMSVGGRSLPTGGETPIVDTTGAAGTAKELLDMFSVAYRKQMMMSPVGEAGRSTLAGDEDLAVAPLDISPLPLPRDMLGLDWTIPPEDIELVKRQDGSYWQVGAGAFGTVYKGIYKQNQYVAVKVLHALGDERRRQEFIREATLLKSLDDPHIVQFLGACLDGPAAMIVTEYMEFGDLWRTIPLRTASGDRIFSWYRRGGRVAVDIAKGIMALHATKIVHLDLKSANILLSRTGQAKVADIGMARVLQNTYLSMLSNQGTFAWSAPEVLNGKRCTAKVDIYSYGIILWELCTGEAPVRGNMRPLNVPEDCPEEIGELQQRCVAEDPGERPTATELVDILSASVVVVGVH